MYIYKYISTFIFSLSDLRVLVNPLDWEQIKNKNSVKSVAGPVPDPEANPSKHPASVATGYISSLLPSRRGREGGMFPIGSQLQANDVIVIISGAIARNVGHQVMKLLRIYSPPQNRIACVYVVHFLPGKINILRVSVGGRGRGGTPVFSFKTRLFANARSGSPTNATENSKQTTHRRWVRPSSDEKDFLSS